jgi:hypothetical protein
LTLELKNEAAIEDALRLAAANAATAAAIAANTVATLPNQPDPNIVVPREGGVSVASGVTVRWTGGSLTRPRRTPREPYAFRPQDVKGCGKTRQMLVSPVEKIFRLGIPMTETKSHKSSIVNAFRPQDVKGCGKTRQMLVSPVEKIFRLGIPMTETKSHKSSIVSLFNWVGHIRHEYCHLDHGKSHYTVATSQSAESVW